MRSDLEVAAIFRRHGHAYRQTNDGHLGRVERRVMSAIELCRTVALGGHVEACEDCTHVRVAYNSCRNRHCPKCQSATRERWVADRQADLLPVPYFHVVFTVPSEVAEIAFHNKAVVYAILFDAVAATLKTIAADARHLGGEIGFLAILHTWGQALTHHPHIHCLVPGGALSSDGRWLGCRHNFFLPVHVLSSLFRRLFLERLAMAYAAGRLRFSGKLDRFDNADVFAAAIGKLRRKNWIVYAKPPFGSPEHVLAYLGRYTHRVAIANSRLVSADGTSVTFRWRDYRHGNAPRLMSLDPHEFIRRFLIHSLPDGFHRIRHYGFLANGCRRARLATIRQLLIPTEPIATVAVAAFCASLPRCRDGVPGNPCLGSIHHDHSISIELKTWQRRSICADDAPCLPSCKSTRRTTVPPRSPRKYPFSTSITPTYAANIASSAPARWHWIIHDRSPATSGVALIP